MSKNKHKQNQKPRIFIEHGTVSKEAIEAFSRALEKGGPMPAFATGSVKSCQGCGIDDRHHDFNTGRDRLPYEMGFKAGKAAGDLRLAVFKETITAQAGKIKDLEARLAKACERAEALEKECRQQAYTEEAGRLTEKDFEILMDALIGFIAEGSAFSCYPEAMALLKKIVRQSDKLPPTQGREGGK